MEPEAARKLLAERLDPKLDVRITLTDGRRYLKRKRREVGMGIDAEGMVAAAKGGRQVVPLRFRINRTVLQKALRHVAAHFDRPGKDAKVKASGLHVRVVPSVDGRVVDAGASAARIASAVGRNPQTTVLRLVMREHAPEVTTAKLRGITGLLARYTTYFRTSEAKRSHNIRAAVRRIDGRLLWSGHVFSLNETVGERTHANGFLTAPVFANHKEVPGIGGGVSQVTGTLFNAALLAGLPIVEYRTHSRPVSYIPIGRDATVAWKQFDMRFKNNTRAPIYIAYKVRGGRLTAALYGARPRGQRVTLRVDEEHLTPTHIKAQLYRTVRRKGVVVGKQRIGQSDYTWAAEEAD